MSNGNNGSPFASLNSDRIVDALTYGFFFAAGTALFGLAAGFFKSSDDDEDDDE